MIYEHEKHTDNYRMRVSVAGNINLAWLKGKIKWFIHKDELKELIDFYLECTEEVAGRE